MTMSKYRIQANRTKPHICLVKYPWGGISMWMYYPPSVSVYRSAKLRLHTLKTHEFTYSRNKIEDRFEAISKNENAHKNWRRDLILVHLKWGV